MKKLIVGIILVLFSFLFLIAGSDGFHKTKEASTMNEISFEQWNYNTAKELERLASTLPILEEKVARTFFQRCNNATGSTHEPSNRTTGNVFSTLQGFVSACERHDLKVDCFITPDHPAYGIMMVESFDQVMGACFVVARISESTFLFLPFVGERAKNAIKALVTQKNIEDTLPDGTR